MRLIIPITLAAVAALVLPLRAHDAAAPLDIRAWMDQYEAALNAKDLDRLARFYHPDVTIYVGGGVNVGWADYRDHHLGSCARWKASASPTPTFRFNRWEAERPT